MRGMKPGCFYYRDRDMDMVVKENQKNLIIIKNQRQIKGVGLGHENGLGAGIVELDETHNIVDKIYLLNNYYYYYIN